MTCGSTSPCGSGFSLQQDAFNNIAGCNKQIDNTEESKALEEMLRKAGFSEDQIKDIMNEVNNRIKNNQPVDEAALADIIGHRSPKAA